MPTSPERDHDNTEIDLPDPAAQSRADLEFVLRELELQKQATSRALQSTLHLEAQLADTREQLTRALAAGSIPASPAKPEPEAVIWRKSNPAPPVHNRRVWTGYPISVPGHRAAAQRPHASETAAHRREATGVLGSLKRGRAVWIALAVGILFGAGFVTWLAERYRTTALANALRNGFGSSSAPTESAHPARSLPPQSQSSPPDALESRTPESSVQDALAGVHRKMAAFPEAKPEEIIAALREGKLNVDPSTCLLAWNNGVAELLVQDRASDKTKAAETMSACASAIDNAHGGPVYGGGAHLH